MTNHSYKIIKRIVDIFGSFLGLVLIAPFLLVLSFLIKVSSNGPVVYRQIRIGLHGKAFQLYKLRSMINNAEMNSGPVLADRNDKRVTIIGKFLRRSRLDETLQLINVLKGEMSLVGPRPERPFFVKQHKVLQGIRLSVKPGLTGLAQVEGYYHTHPRNKLRYDYIYIKNQSILLDLKILLKTLFIIFTRSGS